MHFVPGYSMMAATATTFMLSMIFLLLSGQSKKQYMRFWGLSWLVYSAMFLLDFCHLNWNFVYLGYVMLRQMLALLGSYTFLLGTHHFFQIKCPAALGFCNTGSPPISRPLPNRCPTPSSPCVCLPRSEHGEFSELSEACGFISIARYSFACSPAAPTPALAIAHK